MKLTIVRHGETIQNAKGILMGQSHGTLSSLGKKQARSLGKRLLNYKFDVIYCSDLKRCKDTTKEIRKYHKEVPVRYSKEIRERHMGEFTNKRRVKTNFDTLPGSYLTRKPNGGESYSELIKRVRKFIRVLKKNHKNDKVLVVTHGGPIRVFNHLLNKANLRDLVNNAPVANTSICEYIIEGKRIRQHRYNDSEHL